MQISASVGGQSIFKNAFARRRFGPSDRVVVRKRQDTDGVARSHVQADGYRNAQRGTGSNDAGGLRGHGRLLQIARGRLGPQSILVVSYHHEPADRQQPAGEVPLAVTAAT